MGVKPKSDERREFAARVLFEAEVPPDVLAEGSLGRAAAATPFFSF